MLRSILGRAYKSWVQYKYPKIQIAPSSTIFPLAIRNATKESKLVIGEDTVTVARFSFDRPTAEITIGRNTFVGKSHLVTAQKISIGDDVLISWGVTISDHDSHNIAFSKRATDHQDLLNGRKDWTHVRQTPVKICDKAWIGFNAIILQGVTIGEGAVVGAGALVTKDVPPWTIVGGNPAKVIRELSEDER